MQRTRTLRTHEELLRKYNQKGGGGEKTEKKKEKMHTFQPKLSEGEKKIVLFRAKEFESSFLSNPHKFTFMLFFFILVFS